MVVGARSAVFAPVGNLRLIVVDEEHEPAYKQDETPRYHGRDVAVMRAKIAGIPDGTYEGTAIVDSDGTCDAYFVHPATGTAPGVLFWPDIFGLRPAFKEMGKRLAEAGYSVLVVNPFYRKKKAPTAPEKANFSDPATREMLFGQTQYQRH